MKIQIWQQFSANHSGRYSVVGIFDTPQDAKEAAKLIWSTLDEWAIQKMEPYVADNYTSWLFSVEPPENVIYYFDRLLMIGSGLQETWDPVAPILDLLHLLTVDTAYHYNESVVLLQFSVLHLMMMFLDNFLMRSIFIFAARDPQKIRHLGK